MTVRCLIGWALTAAQLPEWQHIIGIAHDKTQARIPYRAVSEDLTPLARRYGPAARGGLNVTRYLGIRSGMYGLPREYHIGTREARNTLRGESVDLAPFDEVRTQIDMETWGALGPTMLARPEPLGFATSTAGNDRSVLLRQWFDRGVRIIDGAEPMADFGMTWYASSERYGPDDPRSWREANPAYAEGRLSTDAIRALAMEFGGFDTALWRSEGLNLWTDAVDSWLPSGVWARQTVQDRPDRGRVVFGIEATPSWNRCTVTVAWATPDGAYVGVAGDDDASRPRPDGTIAASIAPADMIALLSQTGGRMEAGRCRMLRSRCRMATRRGMGRGARRHDRKGRRPGAPRRVGAIPVGANRRTAHPSGRSAASVAGTASATVRAYRVGRVVPVRPGVVGRSGRDPRGSMGRVVRDRAPGGRHRGANLRLTGEPTHHHSR